MSQELERSRERHRRFWEQLAEIERRQGYRLVVEPATATPESGVSPRYAYQAGRLLLRADDEGRLEAAMGRVRERLTDRFRDTGRVAATLATVELDADVHVPTEVDALNRMFRQDDPEAGRVAVSPDHLVSIASPVNFCPADEPKPVAPVTPPWPPRATTGGEDVHVLVIDTGLVEDHGRHAWLAAGVEVDGGYRQTVDPDDPYGLVKQYAGHGTFVAGVLRCAAPDARVTVSGLLSRAGALLEHEFGEAALAATEAHGWPPIISLSAGGTSHRSRDLLGLQPFLDELARHPHTLLVAAAGNDGNDDNLFFPAASAATHPGVMSVGALRRDQRGRACFSNYGASVTVFAPGEHHVNAFLSGMYAYQHQPTTHCRYHEPPLYPDCTCLSDPDYGTVRQFSGMARWSGTSFATPLVAGMIATHMTRTREHDPRAAARDLLAGQRREVADIDGAILPVLRLAD